MRVACGSDTPWVSKKQMSSTEGWFESLSGFLRHVTPFPAQTVVNLCMVFLWHCFKILNPLQPISCPASLETVSVVQSTHLRTVLNADAGVSLKAAGDGATLPNSVSRVGSSTGAGGS